MKATKWEHRGDRHSASQHLQHRWHGTDSLARGRGSLTRQSKSGNEQGPACTGRASAKRRGRLPWVSFHLIRSEPPLDSTVSEKNWAPFIFATALSEIRHSSGCRHAQIAGTEDTLLPRPPCSTQAFCCTGEHPESGVKVTLHNPSKTLLTPVKGSLLNHRWQPLDMSLQSCLLSGFLSSKREGSPILGFSSCFYMVNTD